MTKFIYSNEYFTPATVINNGLPQVLEMGKFAVVEKMGEILTLVSEGKTPEEAISTAIMWEPSLKGKIEGFEYEGKDGVYVMPTQHWDWKEKKKYKIDQDSSETVVLDQYY